MPAVSSEVTDTQWAEIEPLLPPKARTGRPRADDRRTLNGILWVLRTGSRWADMPREYGAPSTVHLRFQQWQAQSVWRRIWRAYMSTLDEKTRQEWEQAPHDVTFVPASQRIGRRALQRYARAGRQRRAAGTQGTRRARRSAGQPRQNA